MAKCHPLVRPAFGRRASRNAIACWIADTDCRSGRFCNTKVTFWGQVTNGKESRKVADDTSARLLHKTLIRLRCLSPGGSNDRLERTMDMGETTTVATTLNTYSRTLQSAKVREVVHSNDAREVGRPRRFAHGFRSRGLALGIFQQELKLALSAGFRRAFHGYTESTDGATAREIAAETLRSVKKLSIDSSAAASGTFVNLKSKVEQAATTAHEIAGSNEDFGELEEAIQLVNEGLDELEAEAAQTFKSSASVLAVFTELSQRSTIRIRTQEGDIVRLDLRRTDNLSATDVALSDEDGSASAVQIEVSSSSRLSFTVKGDLNEAELAAIQNIFAQAEAIANEFFEGDLAAAFDLASALEFDTEQLARLSMRFHERQLTEVNFAAVGSLQTGPMAEIEPVLVTSNEATPEASASPPVAADQADVMEAIATEAGQPVQGEQSGELRSIESALAGLFDLVSNFLRSVAGSFEGDNGNKANSARYIYSESFKLELLKTVIEVAAPGESKGDAEMVRPVLIDAVLEERSLGA